MHAITRRTLAGLAVFAAPALAAAQLGPYTTAFGAPVRTETAGAHGLTPPSGTATYTLLASHDCATLGVGVCSPTKEIQQGNGTWNYQPYNSSTLLGGVSTFFTGSVTTTTVTLNNNAGLFGFNFALLYNPTNYADDGLSLTGADVVMARLFQGSAASGTALFEALFQLSPTSAQLTVAAPAFGVGATPVGALPLSDVAAGSNGVFTKTSGWLSLPAGAPLPDGTYTFEFGVVDQGNKDYVVGLALDNLAPQNVVPEPSTYALLGAGLAGLLGAARRRRA